MQTQTFATPAPIAAVVNVPAGRVRFIAADPSRTTAPPDSTSTPPPRTATSPPAVSDTRGL